MTTTRVSLSYSADNAHRLSLSESVGKCARSLVLWTERGAARHAKMLETDQAWEVFEKLEDFYFSKKQLNGGTTKHGVITGHAEKLDLLRSAVNMLANNRGISYQRAYSLVHKQFGVRRIEDIDPARLSDAVAYSYKEAIEGEFVGREQSVTISRCKMTEKELNDLIWVWVAAKHMLDIMKETEPALRDLQHEKTATVTSMLAEYPRTLREAVGFLRRESDHIVVDENNVNHLTWLRSLPLIRQIH